jgi:hypothetical protein
MGGVETFVITKLLEESGLKNVSAEPMVEITRNRYVYTNPRCSIM